MKGVELGARPKGERNQKSKKQNPLSASGVDNTNVLGFERKRKREKVRGAVWVERKAKGVEMRGEGGG